MTKCQTYTRPFITRGGNPIKRTTLVSDLGVYIPHYSPKWVMEIAVNCCQKESYKY